MFRKEIREYPPYGTFQMVNVERLKKGIEARDFFLEMLRADCDRIAVENPMPMSVFCLPRPSQCINPWMFDEPYSKRTYLWLKGLPPLMATVIDMNYHPFICGGGGRMERENYKGQTFASGGVGRSKSFTGIAQAMADQWTT